MVVFETPQEDIRNALQMINNLRAYGSSHPEVDYDAIRRRLIDALTKLPPFPDRETLE